MSEVCDQCGTGQGVIRRIDPYTFAIIGDEDEYPMCGDCARKRTEAAEEELTES